MRAQIALWMLTKFAMVFFIILLAVIMVSFTDTEKQAICRTQANAIAQSVASTIINVINSPVEDERKVFSLEPSLSVGQKQLERYTINISNIVSQSNPDTGSLVVNVLTVGGCSAGASASYDRSLKLADPDTLVRLWQDSRQGGQTIIELKPSDIYVRDYYLVLAKCRPKEKALPSYLFLRKCSAPLGQTVDPDVDCPPYLELASGAALSTNPVASCCGWEAVEGVNRPQCPN
ncbi:hypothetical protein HY572_02190 [Candidatus Micrarchaeota archaeon]|nr:hypothetical protein [Candidatus Micrarchaeota archaeon]